jgi:YgiT-type zinc finger domain-containing protein
MTIPPRMNDATVTLERGELTLVIKHAPAQVCPNCGEAYLDEAVATDLLQTAERMVQAGAQVDVRRYRPAMASV